MRVILLSDIKPLGAAGTVVDVADGYARNYLLPRKLAAEASQGAIAMIEAQRRSKARQEAEALAEAQALAGKLESGQLNVAVKAGGNGRLFGTVTGADVAQAIMAAYAIEVDRHRIELPDTIKALGSYPIEVKLAKNVVAKTTIKVVPA
jgi:large subunit ribosomal protein L9